MNKLLAMRHRLLWGTAKEQSLSSRKRLGVPVRLDLVPEDVLLEVLSYFRADPRSLKSLSATNRYFRRLCLPCLFRHVVLRSEKLHRDMIQSRDVMEHVQTLELAFDNCQTRDWENVSVFIIPRFKNVTTLVIGKAIFLSSHCMEQLLSMPELETVRVETTDILQATRLPTPLTVHPALRRLEYSFYGRFGPAIPEGSDVEILSIHLTNLTKTCSSTLEYLDAPVWLIRWTELDNLRFPSLRHLYTSGPSPFDPYPFLSVLATHIRTLRSLDICFTDRRIPSLPNT